MDKEQAIQELKQFRDEYIVSRDKILEVWNFFKFNTNEEYYTTLVNNAPVKIRRNLFWDIVNTNDIRKICQKPKVEDNTITPYEQSVTPSGETVNITEITKIRKELLTYKNKLNFERNAFNKNLKEISSLEELNKELIENLKKLKPINIDKGVTPNVPPQNSENTDILLIQLSDVHGGEITEEFRKQGYDFNLLSKRLKKYANKIKEEIITKGYKKVVIFSTGDLINSDSLLSKRLNQTCNKATSIIMMIRLLQRFILDINSVCSDINFGCISANEGRFDKDFYEDESLVTNSPDFIIFNALEFLFEDNDDIQFLQGRNNERLVNINNNYILFTHGICLAKGDLEKSVMQLISRYANRGINVRFVVFGHLHQSRCNNFFMRSGSMVGDNAYSSNTLNLQSRASQNLAIISLNGDITPICVDLENVENIIGYDISYETEKFNLKNATKKMYDHNIEMIL